MTRYALVIGIAQYESSLGSLSKPTSDAEAVARVLEEHGDFQVKRSPEGWNTQRNCYEVAAGPLNGAELGQVLQEFLLKQADRKEALIYFSGHGFTVSDNLRRQKGYLATSDCTAKTIANCGIPLDSFNQLILESNLSSLVVLLDCCHAGSVLESSLVRQSLTAFNSAHKDYYLIAACRDFESAWEGEQYSVFTEALLKGLQPDNAGSDGKVSCDRVFDLIATHLKGSGQEPIRMGWGRSLTLVQYPLKQTKTEVVVNETCPYQGLQPFSKEQARFFFGREKVVQLLVEKLGQANFVPIIGASGSGKSSVVRAGLIPRLEKNGWRVLEPILPGDEPLAELKTVLIELFGRTEGREVYSLIKTDGLRPVIERLSDSERLLLVVDQFEEVFTVCPQEDERRQFIELLTQITEILDSRLAIVTTMRADFLEPCLSYESLTRLIQNEAVYMPPLVGVELEEAIEEPTKLQGYSFEKGLLGEILRDVGQEKECLPLLQFTLMELWEKRDRKKHQLTVEQYQVLEGVAGALDRHAEKIYTYKDFAKESPQQKRSPQEQEWIKRIFLRLVRTGEGIKDTRQRQPKARLLAIAEDNLQHRQAFIEVLDELIQGRLLVTGQEQKQAEAWVDLAHEALMEGWQRFGQWRQENRHLRRLIERIEDARREWLKNQKDENFLMMGGLLAQVRERWLEIESNVDSLTRWFYEESDAQEQADTDDLRRIAEFLEQGLSESGSSLYRPKQVPNADNTSSNTVSETPISALKELVGRLHREQHKIQDLLSSLGFALRSFNNLNQFLELVPLFAARVTDADSSALILFKPNGRVQLVRLSSQEGQADQKVRQAIEKATRQIFFCGSSGETDSANTVSLEVIQASLDEQMSQLLAAEVHLFGIPILVKNSERGRLYVFSNHPDYSWTATRQKLVRLVADQTAVAIETAELRRQGRLEKL